MTEEQYLQSIVEPLLNNPESLKIEKVVDSRGTLLNLSVSSSELGKIIGRDGQTANSLRNIMRIYGAKTNCIVSLKVNSI